MRQRGIFVTGTDTDAGKTWVGQRLIKQLAQSGVHVVPRKIIESGWREDAVEKTDAWQLAKAAGCEQQLAQVCPHHFAAAVSPVRAAALEGVSLHLDEISLQCRQGLQKDDFLYVEGAGGFYSPLVSDGLNADLAVKLGLPVLLVAADKLGCINHILLTLEAIQSRGLHCKAIVLNQLSPDANLPMNNLEDLRGLSGIPSFGLVYQQKALPQAMIQLLL